MQSRDFSVRANMTEWMDGPCTDAELRACLNDLEKVNRVVLVHRPVLQWLTRTVPHAKDPVHIVDVGCGSGDMLRAIERWASRRSLQVQLTGVDLNARTVRIARERTAPDSCIRYICGDAAAQPELEQVNIILSSHVTHHLQDNEIVSFLSWMEKTAQLGWFINDLQREPFSFHVFQFLSNVMRWHPFIRHDGPVSILRSFQPDDWIRYLSLAEIAGAVLEPVFPGRLCVARRMGHA